MSDNIADESRRGISSSVYFEISEFLQAVCDL